MAAPLRRPSVLQLSGCSNRFTISSGFLRSQQQHQLLQNGQMQQIRGKKKMVDSGNTVTVKLLKDVSTFGRKGSYVPISIGQMRNVWFPQRIAEYVPPTQLKDLRAKNITTERDFDFGVVDKQQLQQQQRSAAAAASDVSAQVAAQLRASRTVESNKLTPARSNELLTILVPHRLDFYRQPIEPTPPPTPAPTTPAPTPKRQQQQQSLSGAAADLLSARSQPPPTPTPSSSSSAATAAAAGTPIYGSVSTTDVANAVKAALAHNDEASKLTLSGAAADGEIRFVGLADDKVKQLGEFEVEIRVRGADAAVTKAVRVLPLEKQDA